MGRPLLYGFLLWLAGTIFIRFRGDTLLRPGRVASTLILYAASFLLMAILVPRILRRLKVEKELWFEATALLILPTLILDPLACVFFSRVYPNLDPAAAGTFGGWMLIFCAGAITGVWFSRISSASDRAAR
ncbi:MAG TPA: DUF5367 family protein [Candidatus Sulfotelmatobacter sp.]|nr:DUF5367 family protein [Candidatus Sulfotelmatobacter sp.]